MFWKYSDKSQRQITQKSISMNRWLLGGIITITTINVALLLKYSNTDSSINFDQTWNIFERKIPKSTQNIIVILGKGLNINGEPSNELVKRIDLGVSTFYDKHLSFDDSVFIVTGGDLSNHEAHFHFNHKTEAHIMSQILYNKHNIPLTNIYWDYFAKETMENFFNVLKYIRQSHVFKVDRVYIVTSDYHMPRSLHIFNTLNRNPFINSNDETYRNLEDKWLEITDKIYPISLKTNKTVASYMEKKSDWSSGYLYHLQSYLWTGKLYNPQYEFNVI